MSSENVDEAMATDSAGKLDAANKFGGKKWGMIGAIAVVLIALIIGIGIYNTPANRLSRQLDLGNRYLEEQNYEQAIVEFDKVIAIDPMSVEAYLGKADAYIGMGDLQSALDTLQTGYDLTGDERLKEKLNEIEAQLNQVSQPEEVAQSIEEIDVQEERDYIELPFSVSNIKLMGYSLDEAYIENIAPAFGFSLPADGVLAESQYGDVSIFHMDENRYTLFIDKFYDAPISLSYLNDTNVVNFQLGIKSSDSDVVPNFNWNDEISFYCDIPVYPGAPYEEWCEKLGINAIEDIDKEDMVSRFGAETITVKEGMISDGTTRYKVSYTESLVDGSFGVDMYCRLQLYNSNTGEVYAIFAQFQDKFLRDVRYDYY